MSRQAFAARTSFRKALRNENSKLWRKLAPQSSWYTAMRVTAFQRACAKTL